MDIVWVFNANGRREMDKKLYINGPHFYPEGHRNVESGFYMP
jgi:hypothetical protein